MPSAQHWSTADGGWQPVSVPASVAEKLLQKDGRETWHRGCIVKVPVQAQRSFGQRPAFDASMRRATS